jgi:hypothetical protein
MFEVRTGTCSECSKTEVEVRILPDGDVCEPCIEDPIT